MNTGVHQDQLGFTFVDLNKVAYKDEPFIMAEQSRQVFYVQDPCDSRLSMVLQGRPSGISHQNDDLALEICEMPAFCIRMPSIIEEHEVDDVHANCNDHDEGLWENIPT